MRKVRYALWDFSICYCSIKYKLSLKVLVLRIRFSILQIIWVGWTDILVYQGNNISAFSVELKLTGCPGAPLFPFLPGRAPSPYMKTLCSWWLLCDTFYFFHLLKGSSYVGPLNSFNSWRTRRTSRPRLTFAPWKADKSNLPHSPLWKTLFDSTKIWPSSHSTHLQDWWKMSRQ